MASKPFLYLLKKRVFSGYNKANKEIDWPIIPQIVTSNFYH